MENSISDSVKLSLETNQPNKKQIQRSLSTMYFTWISPPEFWWRNSFFIWLLVKTHHRLQATCLTIIPTWIGNHKKTTKDCFLWGMMELEGLNDYSKTEKTETWNRNLMFRQSETCLSRYILEHLLQFLQRYIYHYNYLSLSLSLSLSWYKKSA